MARASLARSSMARARMPAAACPARACPARACPHQNARSSMPRTSMPRSSMPRARMPAAACPAPECPRQHAPHQHARARMPAAACPRQNARGSMPRSSLPAPECPQQHAPRTSMPAKRLRTSMPAKRLRMRARKAPAHQHARKAPAHACPQSTCACVPALCCLPSADARTANSTSGTLVSLKMPLTWQLERGLVGEIFGRCPDRSLVRGSWLGKFWRLAVARTVPWSVVVGWGNFAGWPLPGPFPPTLRHSPDSGSWDSVTRVIFHDNQDRIRLAPARAVTSRVYSVDARM